MWKPRPILNTYHHQLSSVSPISSYSQSYNDSYNNYNSIYNYPSSYGRSDTNGVIKRKTFVIDLDETLIHASPSRYTYKNYDFSVTFRLDRHTTETFYVQKRPHLDHFLRTVRNWFDLVIFTASARAYADAILDKIDVSRMFKKRFYFDDCMSGVKDLRRVTNDMKNVFILDDRRNSSTYNPENAIPITPFQGDEHDNALCKYLPFLQELKNEVDVRPKIVEFQRKHMYF